MPAAPDFSSGESLTVSPDRPPELPCAKRPHVIAVIVSYWPDIVEFQRVLASVREQVARVVVVDNGSGEVFLGAIAAMQWPELTLLALSSNKGIAAAQNTGIRYASEQEGVSHILLLDHDSLPQPGMVTSLMHALERLEVKGHRAAMVGPAYVDPRQGLLPVFVRVKGFSLSRVLAPDFEDLARVDHLIASGSLIPVPVLREVGLMDESLFIDYVDVEWGLRARSRGYDSFGCYSAHMTHTLGDAPIRLLGRSYPARTPLRHYYTFRNAVLLTRRSYIGLNWKVANLLGLILKFVFYLSFSDSRFRHLEMMSLGVWHGLRKRSGPLPDTL